jgi:hypothetical protein
MLFANKIKDLFTFRKLYSVFLHHFWFWRKRFLKEMLFGTFGTLCALCALDEVFVHKIFRHLPKLHVCKKIKFVGVVVFENRFEAKVDGNTYTCERP